MSGAEPISVVLFDIGGVLLPFDQQKRIAATAAALGVGEERVREALTADLFADLDLGRADEGDCAAALSRLAARPVEVDEARELILSVFEAPNMELWDLAERLRDRIAVGAFSDNPPFVRAMFPRPDILDPVFFSAELGARKPTPGAFAAVERRLGNAPQTLLLIDDNLLNVAAARRRGWSAIRYRSNATLVRQLRKKGLA